MRNAVKFVACARGAQRMPGMDLQNTSSPRQIISGIFESPYGSMFVGAYFLYRFFQGLQGK